MKAIKNKKRFDARRFLSERKEETKENVEKTNANFNDFSFDNWLEEGSVKEMQIGDGAAGDHSHDPWSTPTTAAAKPNSGITVKIRSQVEQDRILQGLSNDIITRKKLTRKELTTDTGAMEEECGGPEMGPEEAEPAIADLSPDEAFGAGYTSAVEEIMASIQGLLEDPMDMGPAGEEGESALVVTQLPDHAMEINEDDDVVVQEDSDPDWSAAINDLIDAFQEEREMLKESAPKTYGAIMDIVNKRTQAPRIRDFDAEDRKMDFRDDAIDDYPGHGEGWKLEES